MLVSPVWVGDKRMVQSAFDSYNSRSTSFSMVSI